MGSQGTRESIDSVSPWESEELPALVHPQGTGHSAAEAISSPVELLILLLACSDLFQPFLPPPFRGLEESDLIKSSMQNFQDQI